MLVSVIKANYIKEYKVKLHFDNGESGIVDLESTIFNDHRKIFKPLRNIDFFKSFKLDSWTMTWSNEADFSPEFLYDLSLKSKEKAHGNR